ncbi:unnamed protein product [Clonostachys chloroleuca]|uniref:Uncharacterized protein n=1 Tax=Clonostachys chloroleuca TaxID=1926264 RepID=A0AA35Q4C2_9HYPO|nr:unnamed protein product [Clonostachys chloroleuca]
MPSGSGSEENKKWGFGQVMPMVLLAAPLVPVVEATIRTCLYRDNLDETTNYVTDQAPLLNIPIQSLDPVPPIESDTETQNDALPLIDLRIAPRQEFEHEIADCYQLLNHETMILATMLPQTGGLLFASYLFVAGGLHLFASSFDPTNPGNRGSFLATAVSSIVAMPSMYSGYMWISLCCISFWTNMRKGWLNWLLCLFWASVYLLWLFFMNVYSGGQLAPAAAFGPLILAVLVPFIYTPFRLRRLKGMGQQVETR